MSEVDADGGGQDGKPERDRDGVDLSTGAAVLLIGDIRVPLGSLKSIRAASS